MTQVPADIPGALGSHRDHVPSFATCDKNGSSSSRIHYYMSHHSKGELVPKFPGKPSKFTPWVSSVHKTNPKCMFVCMYLVKGSGIFYLALYQEIFSSLHHEIPCRNLGSCGGFRGKATRGPCRRYDEELTFVVSQDNKLKFCIENIQSWLPIGLFSSYLHLHNGAPKQCICCLLSCLLYSLSKLTAFYG